MPARSSLYFEIACADEGKGEVIRPLFAYVLNSEFR